VSLSSGRTGTTPNIKEKTTQKNTKNRASLLAKHQNASTTKSQYSTKKTAPNSGLLSAQQQH